MEPVQFERSHDIEDLFNFRYTKKCLPTSSINPGYAKAGWSSMVTAGTDSRRPFS
jgi:hypothetical protein